MTSDRSTVTDLLRTLHKIIRSHDFDIDRDYILVRSEKEDAEHSTPFTMITLQKLTLKNYSQTLVDRDDDEPPYLYVFGKVINEKMVYIKFKIREGSRKVICISFHYASSRMSFPYL
jgi:hypothetical protein